MNIRQLTYFQAVVEEGGFSAASRRLNIAQPAISGHVAALEEELGVKLLERSNKGVRRTSAGRRMSEHTANILRQMEIAKHDVSGSGGDPSGEVMVALPFTSALLLAGRVQRLVEEKFPRVTLNLFEGLSNDSGNIMASGRVDLGIVPNAAEIANLDVQPIFFENLYLVGRWDKKQPREREIRFADLTNYPLAMGSRAWNLRRTIEETSLNLGVPLNTRYEIPGANSLFSVISEGLGHTICNWAMLQPSWDQQKLFAWKIIEPDLRRTITLAWPSERPMTEAVDGVRRILAEVLIDAVHAGEWRGELIE